ncbi:snaclec 3-like [Lytechinus variegatus]|uniref:snaclec 3-like n=1 Tax=Lytechinus variegatus TaxID=7654 RepID=UPI001BB1D7A7|nr:snaclec 3-like [Lytechinus variegatus]
MAPTVFVGEILAVIIAFVGADAISASPTQISLTPTTLPSPTKPKNLSSTNKTQSSQTTTSISTLSTPSSTPTTSTPAPLLTMSTFTSTPATLTSLTITTQPTPSTNPSVLSSIASSPTTASTAIATPTTPTKSCAESWSYYEGWCYGYFRDPVNFGSALSTCRTIAGLEADLVSIHSDAENAFVYDLWVSLEEYIGELLWIGYHQPTNGVLEPFVWTDGTPDDYASWEPTQPDDEGGNENCVSFWRRNPSDDAAKPWNDVPCDIVTAPFVCKAAI